MAGFTEYQWEKINKNLRHNPNRYGMPIRRKGSVIIGSFNVLKLGRGENSAKNWDFLKRFASRCDLLAVQEVMDELSGIRRLHKSLGVSFKLIISDTTGAFPGTRGLRERLAFIYRPSQIELNELVADITYDRSVVTASLHENIGLWKDFFDDIAREHELRQQQGKRVKSLSDFSHPAFLTFIRTPYCASFSIKGKNGAGPIEFLGVNAHMLYGNSKEERNREFFALLDWIIQRAKSSERMYFKNMILMGDLNMEFDNAENKYSDIMQRLHQLDSSLLTGQSAARANFPFLDVHPNERALFNTNARKNQTFDHIAFFIDKKEKGLPFDDFNHDAGQGGIDGYDYGVFDFVELCADSIYETSFHLLTPSRRKTLLRNVKADISDHMPIWVRVPIPGV